MLNWSLLRVEFGKDRGFFIVGAGTIFWRIKK